MSSPDHLIRYLGGPTATMALKQDLPFESGLFTVELKLTATAGVPQCAVRVGSTSMALTNRPFAGVGEHTLQFTGVLPGDTVTDLEINCPGAGTADLDWVTVQNGAYSYGPMLDVDATWETMGLPGMGRQSVVRASQDAAGDIGTLMFVGSDVGGLGWSEDGYTWNTANGRGTDWTHGGHYGVWEVWAQDEASLTTQDVIVLTGNKDSGDDGGLWYTQNLDSPAQSWTKVTTASGDLGAAKHVDDCANLAYKGISSGHLIVNHPADTTATRFLVASQDPDTLGLWQWTKPGTPAAAVYQGALPADGIPSALAIDSSGEFLLVGYRVLSTSGGESGALYVCDADWETAAGRFFVADGGRRWDTTADCVARESTVYVVEVSGAAWPPAAIALADTDDAVADSPSWTGGSAYFDSTGCGDATALTPVYGELVSPRIDAEGYELSSIAVDPDGRFLFAFYPYGDNRRDYACVRTFRVELPDSITGTLPWLPFQGWESDRMHFWEDGTGSGTHAAERRAHVGVTGSTATYDAFMASEPLLDAWAGVGTHDATFVPCGEAHADLLTGGNFLWIAHHAEGAPRGWDTPAPASVSDLDLDQVEWDLAWDGESAVFQDATGKAIAVCPGCIEDGAYSIDLTLAAGVGDYKMARLYGEPSWAAARRAADRSCEVHMMNSTGYDVSIWPGDGTAAAQAWMALVPQDDARTDAQMRRGVLFLDDVSGDDWCWDAVEEPGDTLSNTNFLVDDWTDPTTRLGDQLWELHCQDSSKNDEYAGTPAEWWDACDQDAVTDDPWNMGDAGVGQVLALHALGEDQAVLAAAPGTMPDMTSGGEGVWLATYDATDGIAYEEIPYPSAGITFGAATCDASEFFAWTSQVALAVDPTSNPLGDVRAFLTSRHADCGVVELAFNVATASSCMSSCWSVVSLTDADPYADCDLSVTATRGAAVSRDGRWLLVYGGPNAGGLHGGICAIDLENGNAAEQAVPGAALDVQLTSLLPHPHLDDVFYAGGQWADGTTRAPGLFSVQRRYRPDTATWTWSFRALPNDTLEHRTVIDVDWGVGYQRTPEELYHLYVTTAGGGFWDGTVSD